MLFALVSLYPLYFLGLGLFLDKYLFKNRDQQSVLEKLFWVYGLGILFNFLLIVASPKLSISEILGIPLSIIGLLVCRDFLRDILSTVLKKPFNFILITVVCGFFLHQILVVPIFEWDPRSIWFFYAKVIYHSDYFLGMGDALKLNAGNHPDYPKLVPAMAAQLANVVGFWNEFLPKFSLAPIFIHSSLGFFIWSKEKWYTQLTSLVIFLSLGTFTWNGYMDGYVSLYGGLFCFWSWSLIKTKKLSKNIFLCAAIFLNIKNEGIVFSLVFGTLLVIYGVRHKVLFELVKGVRKYLLEIVLMLLPFVIWVVAKKSWGFTDTQITFDLALVQRMIARVHEIPFLMKELIFIKYIVPYIIVGGVASLLALAFLKLKNRLKVNEISLFAWVCGLYYFGIIFLVYLQTMAPLRWHLNTSANRTLMPVLVFIWVGTMIFLKDLGNEKEINNKSIIN
ncbi:MAG: hypothetical protein HOE90_00690 [Bacteriovoracaceae bacterium]|jgi:hypothetical protein|nr:hypothetical protein [Bacteriovoracaceae bacterium]